MNTFVVYHGGSCLDGFTAAWIARKKLGTGEDVRYIAANYGEPPPAVGLNDVLYVLDFSYPRAVLEKLDAQLKRGPLRVIDHHKTAQADLAGLPFCTFDMEHSGAMLAWQHFFPAVQAPELVRYVEDRDLWRFTLLDSKPINAWLRTRWECAVSKDTPDPDRWLLWDELSKRLASGIGHEQAKIEGLAMLQAQCASVLIMVQHAVWKTLGGHRVPVANATCLFSEVGDALCEWYPEAPFAAYWFDRADGRRQWGLRSRSGFDVSAVAKQYGGGGHPAAAGFTSSPDLPPGRVPS